MEKQRNASVRFWTVSRAMRSFATARGSPPARGGLTVHVGRFPAQLHSFATARGSLPAHGGLTVHVGRSRRLHSFAMNNSARVALSSRRQGAAVRNHRLNLNGD